MQSNLSRAIGNHLIARNAPAGWDRQEFGGIPSNKVYPVKCFTAGGSGIGRIMHLVKSGIDTLPAGHGVPDP
jgi:hypothetical protein